MPATVNEYAHMQARGGKQQVVRQYPEPVTDVHRGQQSGDSGKQIEVWKCVVKKLRQPDLAGHQIASIEGDLLGFTEGAGLHCRIAEHHCVTRSMRFDNKRTLYGHKKP